MELVRDKNTFLRSRNLSAGLVLLTLLGPILAFGVSQDACNDVWAHALHGKVMLERHRFPKFSDYSFVSGEDMLLTMEWLPALISYFLLATAGYPGLLLFKTAVLALTALFLLSWLQEEDVPLALAACACAGFMLVSYSRFMPRADMLNMMFLSLYLALLTRYARRGGRAIWLLPLLHLFWTEFHYLSCLGIFTILLFAGIKKETRLLDVRLLKIAGLSLLTSFMTATTYRKALEPFKALWEMNYSQQEMYGIVIEFFPIFFYTGRLEIAPASTLLKFAVPFALVLLVFWLNRGRIYLRHLLLFAFISLMTLRFRRFLGIFGIVSVPILAIYARQWLHSRAVHFRQAALFCTGAAVVVNISLTAFVAFNILYRLEGRPVSCTPSPSPLYKPVRAVEFLQRFAPGGNICCDYNMGGYVGYHLYPRGKIFAHSLALSYSYKHFLLVKTMMKGDMDLNAMARSLGVDIFLIMYNEPYALKNVGMLHDSGWKLVYLDDVTAVYAHPERFPDLPPLNLVVFSPENRILSPAGYCRLGGFFMEIGSHSNAQLCFERALLCGVDEAESHYGLGEIAMREERMFKALEHFVASARIEPSHQALDKIGELLDRIPQRERDTGLYRDALQMYHRWKVGE